MLVILGNTFKDVNTFLFDVSYFMHSMLSKSWEGDLQLILLYISLVYSIQNIYIQHDNTPHSTTCVKHSSFHMMNTCVFKITTLQEQLRLSRLETKLERQG